MRARAFTLVELLVGVAIVGVLVAIIVPVYGRIQESGNVTTCLSHLRQLGMSLNRYLGEHDGRMPELALGREKVTDDLPVIDTALAPYVGDPRIFACPSDKKKHLAQVSGTSYFWNSAINGQATSALHLLKLTEEHSRIPLIGDKEGFHLYEKDKSNVLYADGHATNELKFRTEK